LIRFEALSNARPLRAVDTPPRLRAKPVGFNALMRWPLIRANTGLRWRYRASRSHKKSCEFVPGMLRVGVAYVEKWMNLCQVRNSMVSKRPDWSGGCLRTQSGPAGKGGKRVHPS